MCKEKETRKVFLDKLPKKEGIGINKLKMVVDWEKSTGYKVKFIYDNIEGEVEIINYYKKNKGKYINFKYKNNIYSMATSQFLKCQFGEILNKINHNYKYEIGEIITDINSGKLEILEQIRMKKDNKRGYKYRCLICNNEDVIGEYDLINKRGCNVCCNPSQKVLVGYNDMWTTNLKQAKLLLNPEDGYKYTQGAHQFVNWKCLNCGEIIEHKRISDINYQGLSCPKCGDKLPYSEKFVFNFLQQLNIDFIYQLTRTKFKWCGNYRYDFYFKLNNEDYIIETHGFQHYEETGGCYKTLREEKLNDKVKKELAIKNRIKKDNYIIINCKYSELEWIKSSIVDSKLNELFNLNIINWLQCEEYALSSLVKKACELKRNNSNITTTQIGKIIGLHQTTVIKYLKKGTKLGWCKYNSKKESIKSGKIRCRKIIELNNNQIFNSITEATTFYNFKSLSNISACCRGEQNYAGKDPITGEFLKWMYYEDYLKLNSNQPKTVNE